ncbi:hypothetical protein GP486_006835 [Trichoglossum hirsutum]|uniref:Uncharacterized protein n=1 Tax=Trichoglossum hirsutum TaxID=265104 RepID=A0A9P8IIT3_9PEZI|nr:hypothetical protein GP486_006835 [Trichoglossum hirsutum]
MSAQRRPTSKKPTAGTTKDTYDASRQLATEEEVAEALRHFEKTQHEEHEEATRRPAACSATMTRKETLCQRADNEDEEAPGLTEAEFYEKLKDPKTLYQEILQNKLQGNADAYPTEDLRIIYTAGRVSRDALALISPRLSAVNHHAYETIDELYEYLYELYGDPNKERNVRQSFKDLAMKKGQSF